MARASLRRVGDRRRDIVGRFCNRRRADPGRRDYRPCDLQANAAARGRIDRRCGRHNAHRLHSFTLVIAAQIVIGAGFAFVPPGIAAVIAALSWIFYFVGLLGVLTAVFSYTIKKRGGAKLKKLLADRRIAVMVITVFLWNLPNAVVPAPLR